MWNTIGQLGRTRPTLGPARPAIGQARPKPDRPALTSGRTRRSLTRPRVADSDHAWPGEHPRLPPSLRCAIDVPEFFSFRLRGGGHARQTSKSAHAGVGVSLCSGEVCHMLADPEATSAKLGPNPVRFHPPSLDSVPPSAEDGRNCHKFGRYRPKANHIGPKSVNSRQHSPVSVEMSQCWPMSAQSWCGCVK